MKNLYLLLVFILALGNNAVAQITLNAAVDTIHNVDNRKVINTLSNYLTARRNNDNGKDFWLQAEVARSKKYDLYEAHNLYQIPFDQTIILGVTQPQKELFKVKVLFSYLGTDSIRTIWAVNDFYLLKQNNSLKLCNALYVNMRLNHYQSVPSALINYHFPGGYKYKRARIDSANHFLRAIETFFNKKIPGKIEYVTAPTCESLYAILGSSYQAGSMSSSTTFCGYFDADNRLIISSGNEYYKHELLRSMNLLYPKAPDLLQSGITSLWGGTANKAVIYHVKKLYPYLLKHPELLDKPDDFYYFDDETNPSFIFEAIVINYVLKQEGKAGLVKLMDKLPNNTTIAGFLKDHYQVSDTRSFFLKEFKIYSEKKRIDFDNLLIIK